MADDIKIGLDGGPLQSAAKPALDALKQLQVAVDQLDQASLSRLNKETRGLVSTLKTLAASTSSDMQKFVTGVTSAVERAGKEATVKAKSAGKAIGKQFAESMEEEVSRAKVRVSAPRLVLPSGLSASVGGKGIESADSVLAEARKLMAESGALTQQQISQAAKSRAELLKMDADSAKLTYAMRSNYLKAEEVEKRKAAVTEMADASRTFKFRQNFYKAEEVELRKLAAAEAADASRTFKFRQTFYKNEQGELRRQAAQEQADATRTFRMRLSYIKAEQAEAQRAAAARNALIGKNASFSAASQAGQLTRATRVASAMQMGMSEADAVAKYGAAAVAASHNLDRLKGSQDSLHTSMDRGIGSSREMHSAVRGLAGAANALFLTYGSLIPLTATFFTATAVKEAIKAYKDLEYQIKFVRALEEGGGAGVSERSMRLQTGDIAVKAGFDPVEAAKGLRLLAQSGLNAQEALAALPSVLNTARVGELGVADATETLTGQVHAFGLQMSDMERVGDVLAKAGAISNTSVAKMSESMKQASTIAQQYGLKIEEVSTILVAMAKRNITGSSAGTATANLFRELGNPHGSDAKRIAKDLGITLWDPLDQSRKDFFDRFIPELRKSLEVLDPKSQAFVLNRLTNNRGEKALGALLGLTDEALADIKSKLEQASGFTATANEKLLDSVQGDMDRLKAAFTNALAEAGSSGSSDFRQALQGINQIIASDGFQQGLNGLVKGFGALANIGVGAAEVLGTVYGWVSKLFILPEFVNVLGQLYDKLKDPSGTNAAIQQGNAYVTSLDQQIRKVRELIAEKARADGTAPAAGMAALRATRDDAESKLKTAAAARDKIAADRAAGKPAFMLSEGNDYAKAKRAYDDAQAKLLGAHDKNIQLISLERQYKTSNEPTVMPGNALGTGTKSYSIPEKVRGGAARRAADEDYKNEKKRLDLISAGNKLLVEQTDTEAKAREDALKQSYDRGILNYESYQDRLMASQNEQATIRINLAEAERNAIKVGLTDLAQKSAAQKKAGKGDTDDALANEIQAQTQKYLAAEQKVSKLLADQKAESDKALTDKLKPAADVIRGAEKESALEDERMRQEMAKLQLKGSGLDLSEREQFIQAEILRILGEQEKKLISAQATMREMTASGVFKDADTNPEVAAVRDRMQAYIDSKNATLGAARPAIAQAAGDSFDGKQWQASAQRLAGTMEGSIKDALNAGLNGDTSALANFGQTLQKTVTGALVDAFYDAFVKDAVKGLARDLMSSLRGAAGGGGSSSVGTMVSGLGALGGLFGGGVGGITSTATIGTGAAATSAIGAYGTGVANMTNFLPPFDVGGFTGFGGKHEPKGVVHGGEFVVNKESTSKLGLGFLNSLNQYAEGGFVPLTPGPAMTSNPAGRVSATGGESIVFSPSTTIHIDSRSDRAAVLADVSRVVDEKQKQYTEQLKRIKVLPA
ncbi:phage tail tape measure protein [Variovorax paradoxus]|nr:phage tail tape measure protein [Variovorax paradoxus]